MRSTYLLLLSFLFFYSCKKEAGPGGTSSIKGKVYAGYYDKSLYVLTQSSYAPDVDIYIIYGNDFTYGDHQKTSYDGSYEFKYLEKGSYKIYTYSKDTTGKYMYAINKFAPDVAVIVDVDITKTKQTVELPDISILQ
jgi:hypothetical protein